MSSDIANTFLMKVFKAEFFVRSKYNTFFFILFIYKQIFYFFSELNFLRPILIMVSTFIYIYIYIFIQNFTKVKFRDVNFFIKFIQVVTKNKKLSFNSAF